MTKVATITRFALRRASGRGFKSFAIRTIAVIGVACIAASHAAAQSNSAAAAAHKLVGVGSCTSVGCHGGGRPDLIVGSEYNIWIAEDPHARAYSTLFDERSSRMIQLLEGLPSNAPVAAHKDERCLACHSMTHAESKDFRQDVISDGVGCESCHGPAGDWLAVHFENRFLSGGAELSDSEKKRRVARLEPLGFVNTDSLLKRTLVCVSCHVGGPDREVNHDLIAAGHPRLQFEMGAYFEALPKHWLDDKDRNNRSADFDARLWAIGQASTSQAAAEQLARRAESGKTWPEFAEWECSACHHDLQYDSEDRQQRLSDRGGLSGRVIDWDTWNHYVTRNHAAGIGQAFGIAPNAVSPVDKSFASLAEQMKSLSPNRKQLAALAKRTANDLQGFASPLETSNINRPNLERLMRSLLSSETASADWSTAAQTYNALATLQETRLGPARTSNDPISIEIQKLYDELVRKQKAERGYFYNSQNVTNSLNAVGNRLTSEGVQ